MTDPGAELHAMVGQLYPIRRSLTGAGVRETLRMVSRHVPLEVHEVPTGISVLDWTVPEEWNLREAYVASTDGTRVLDSAATSLRVLGYSEPVDAVVSREALLARVHTDASAPQSIPYRTSYYERSWGFCATEAEKAALTDARYRVVIDATLGPGSLTYGEAVIPGESEDEVLLTTHICHPEMANDNCSGIAVLALAGRRLAERRPRLTYRLLFIPGTIGAITWLARNRQRTSRIVHGLVLAGLGDRGALTYQRSRSGRATVDRAAGHVVGHLGGSILDFSPWGYDERQFNSPGFALPVGRLSRTPHGTYPEYHTSADDLAFVTPTSLEESLTALERICDVLEGDGTWRNLRPEGEPQLGRRGLYDAIGGQPDPGGMKMALLWVLNLSDGTHSLLDVAERSGLPFDAVSRAARLLHEADLLAPDPGAGR